MALNIILIKKQGDLSIVSKITRDKAVQAYYAKHKNRIDKVLGAIGNQTITPKQKFEALAYAHVAPKFDTKASANQELGLLIDAKQYSQDYADSRRALLELKKENKYIDLRKRKYNISKFSKWADLPDDTYIMDRDTGDWNGGTQMVEYINRFSVNKEANIVLYYGYGNTIGGEDSPFETSGTMSIAKLEGILGKNWESFLKHED